MMLRLYQLLTFISGPLIDLYLLKRKKMGKEDEQRFSERLGYGGFPRPKGSVVWVHAASVGEALSILPIINKLNGRYKNMSFLLTTGTTTSAKLIESRLPKEAFHQYVPVDKIMAVSRFLKHWKPNLALWVESELWPNLVTQTSNYCPIILVNGRMSDASYNKWQKYKSLGKQVVSRFTLTLPQSKHDAERFERLGARNVKYLGNIKFDAPALPSDSEKMGVLIGQIGQRPVWLASSTHANEEQFVAQIHKSLKESHQDLLTIIAPRHPKRAEEIEKDILQLNLNVSVRSKDQPITDQTDIYLADTLGELGLFYRLVPVVFIGGSLVERGGQNPLEAARLDCAIIYGPHMDNFIEIKRELEMAKAAICIKNKAELEESIDTLLTDHTKQEELANAASKIVEEKSGVLDAFVNEIIPYLDKIADNKNEVS